MLRAFIKEVVVNVDSIEIHYNFIGTKRPDGIPHQAFYTLPLNQKKRGCLQTHIGLI